jgi:outer membrane immunogenic protein
MPNFLSFLTGAFPKQVVPLSTVVIASLLTAGLGTASAADLALKAPAAPPPYNWTGFSLGVAAGFGWGDSRQTDPGIPCSFFGTCGGGSTVSGGGGGSPLPVADGSYSPSGAVAGGTLGYDWQLGHWVLGMAGDYSWSGIGGKSDTCGASSPAPHACGTTLDSFGTLRGRVGYALGRTSNWLPYLTGGVAAGQVHAWDSLLPSSGDAFRVGWTVGAGLETALTQAWRAKIEYLYMDLGSLTFNVVPGVLENVTFKTSVVRAGLSYAFH